MRKIPTTKIIANQREIWTLKEEVGELEFDFIEFF